MVMVSTILRNSPIPQPDYQHRATSDRAQFALSCSFPPLQVLVASFHAAGAD